MMEELAEKMCTPCRGGIPPLAREEAEGFRLQVPEWGLVDDAHRIERSFRFVNFRAALSFVQRVGELAETQGHHPDISFGWDEHPERAALLADRAVARDHAADVRGDLEPDLAAVAATSVIPALHHRDLHGSTISRAPAWRVTP